MQNCEVRKNYTKNKSRKEKLQTGVIQDELCEEG
jgi:hypothetical protein